MAFLNKISASWPAQPGQLNLAAKLILCKTRMFPIAQYCWDFEAACGLPLMWSRMEVAGLVWRGILENAPQKPQGTHTLEADQKAAFLPRPQAACSPLEKDPVSISLFFPSWCLPNETTLESKINRCVAE